MPELSTLKRKTVRFAKIANNVKKAKQFQRTDYGGRDQIEAIYEYINEEVDDKGGRMGQSTRCLVAKAMLKLATKQVASCRKRTNKPLNEILKLIGH